MSVFVSGTDERNRDCVALESEIACVLLKALTFNCHDVN